MASVFVYHHDAAPEIDERYASHDIQCSNDAAIIINHCYAEQSPFDIFVVMLEHNEHHELDFFRKANLLWHGTPFVIVTDSIEPFRETLGKLQFSTICTGEQFISLLLYKWEYEDRSSLDYYGSTAIHISPDQLNLLPRLIDCVAHDLEIIRRAKTKSPTVVSP